MTPPNAARPRGARPRAPLPVRDGVGPSCAALPAGDWATIAQCLMQRFAAVRPHQARLRVYYYRSVPDEVWDPLDVEVVYRDEHLLVADKPHFMPVTPSGGQLQHALLVRLRRRLGLEQLTPVHRIDRETAGLVLFSVNASTRAPYHALFAQRRVHKTYECIAARRDDLSWPLERASRLEPDVHFMRMREVDGVANARTRLAPVQTGATLARYRLHPETGLRHQLRVHCAALGLPILGDRLYPTLQPAHTDDPSLPLQLLAQALAFTDPLTGREHAFASARRLSLPDPSRGAA